ncbi:tetratricopeptide repeat protein [Flavobacterium sp. GSP27]|nr:tetratricopeptide repeat protein [Flavobacterium sp. GSP27]
MYSRYFIASIDKLALIIKNTAITTRQLKKISFTFFALFLTFWTFGQTNISDLEKVDGLWTKKGATSTYTGEFVETFENGKTKGTGNFVKGQLEGLRIQFFENGQKRTEKFYKTSHPHGIAKEFYENGTLKQVGEFVDNKETGIWTIYYETGEKHVESTFINGVQQGDYMEYSKDGKLLVKYYFVNGKASYSDEFIKLTKEAIDLSRQFKNEEAIKLYDKAIELNPTVAQAYFNRGACKGNSFDFEGAIKDYDKAIELNPEYMKAYGNRGNAKINTLTSKGNIKPTSEQTKSACEDFNKAVSLGDKTIGTEDMIYLYCNKNKKK